MRGRPPKPTAELERTGALQRNPKRYASRGAEPVAPSGIGAPPDRLTPAQKAIWCEIVEQTAPGVLLSSDRPVLEVACRLQEKLQQVSIRPGELSSLLMCYGKMGFSPVDRVRVSVQRSADSKDSRFREVVAALRLSGHTRVQ